MQSNDVHRSSFPGTSHLFPNDLQSHLQMLYTLTQQQQQLSSSPPSDSKIKRVKYVTLNDLISLINFFFFFFSCRKSMPLSNDPPTQVPLISATDSSHLNSNIDRDVVKVVTTAGPQSIDREFLTQLLTRKDVIPARKRRDFIPNDMKDDHYWERRRKNNLAAKRSREKRRLNDIVLGECLTSIISCYYSFCFIS